MDLLVLGSSIALVAYLLATVKILSRLFHPEGANSRWVIVFAVIAIVSHILNEVQLLFSQEVINFSLPNVVSLVSLVIAISMSVVALISKVSLLLPVTYFFAAIWQLVLIFIPTAETIPLVAEKLIIVSHISLALIAYCILFIATLYAFQVAYINVKLKNKNLTAVVNLPPLMQVEKQLFGILTLGTITLFISMLIGLFFLDGFFAKENIHKTVLSLLALFFYILIIFGHFKQGWRGHRVLVLTITASILLTLSYFGSRFVKEFLLS